MRYGAGNEVRSLDDIRRRRTLGPDDGVYFVGRPAWLDDALFQQLRDEERSQRESAQHIRDQHFGEMGPVGRAMCTSAMLAAFVAEQGQLAHHSGKANYRYYDIPYSNVGPHTDTDDFTLNLIVMLRHEYADERRSALLLFPHGPDPVIVLLEPGEVILFDAMNVIHARTPLSNDGAEWSVNMGIGFTPEGDLPNPGYWVPDRGWKPNVPDWALERRVPPGADG